MLINQVQDYAQASRAEFKFAWYLPTGYSLSSGRFHGNSEWVVTGAPRYNNMGKVSAEWYPGNIAHGAISRKSNEMIGALGHDSALYG